MSREPICDSCAILVINGLACHERGCPNTGKPQEYRDTSEYDAICAMEAEGHQRALWFLESVRDGRFGYVSPRTESIDVRAQYVDGGWAFHYGDASYDTDHRGWWGASSVSPDDDDVVLIDIARDLIEQAIDDAASVLS